MVITKVSNVWAKCDLPSVGELREVLSYDAEYWERRYGRKQRVVYKKNMVGKTGFFFAGLIPLAQEHFPQAIIKAPSITHYGIKQIKKLGGKEFRPYQYRMLVEALKARRGVLKAPTGAGKTLIEAGVFAGLWIMNGLLIVHTKSLLGQIKNELENLLGEEIGMVGDGKKVFKRVTVGMVQTLSRMGKKELRDLYFGVIIVDECHHSQSKSYGNLLTQIDAPYRFGFSATPKERKEDEGGWFRTTGLLGDIIKEVTYMDVKEYLSVPDVQMIKIPPVWDLYGSNWQRAYRRGIVENNARNNEIIARVRLHTLKPTLILVKLISHGKILRDLLLENNIFSVFVQGEDDIESREKAKDLLKFKGVVIATSVFGEGVDVPSLEVLINAGAGKSQIQTTQRAGRVLRKEEGKTTGIIIDFWDDGNKYLERHSRERYEVYKQLGWLKGG